MYLGLSRHSYGIWGDGEFNVRKINGTKYELNNVSCVSVKPKEREDACLSGTNACRGVKT